MRWLLLSAAMLLPSIATAEIITKELEYEHDGVALRGFLAYDNTGPARKPGVLIIHDWLGCGPFAKGKAEQLAREGYVAFALDMYGKGILARDHREASQRAGQLKKNLPLLRARAQAGLQVLRRQPQVDAERLGAIGFCFGGTCCLELARAGERLAVVSFHGGLGTTLPARPGQIQAKLLVLHGNDDPFVPPAEVEKFQEEMRLAGASLEFVSYPGAVHSFTNPDAGNDNSKGAAYNAQADQASYAAMKAFFAKAFGTSP